MLLWLALHRFNFPSSVPCICVASPVKRWLSACYCFIVSENSNCLPNGLHRTRTKQTFPVPVVSVALTHLSEGIYQADFIVYHLIGAPGYSLYTVETILDDLKTLVSVKCSWKMDLTAIAIPRCFWEAQPVSHAVL